MKVRRGLFKLALACALAALPLLADGRHGETGVGGWGNVPSAPTGARGGAPTEPRLVMHQELGADLRLSLPDSMAGSVAYLGEVPGGVMLETHRGKLVIRGAALVHLAEAGVTHLPLMFVAPSQATIVGDIELDLAARKRTVIFP